MRFGRGALAKLFLSVLFTLSAFSAGNITQEPPPQSRSIRVLFVGNSYTYFNKPPEIFSKLAEYGHQGRAETRMEAPGGWRLKDHWEKGHVLKALHEDKRD
jgi:hypothetical protein